MTVDGVKILPSPIKPLVDKKEYRIIQLPNGLTALLISDLANLTAKKTESIAESDDASHSDDMDSASEEGSDEEMANSEDEMEETADEQKETRYLAAASLCIGAGSFEDHGGVQGLMHFLEHMVFMGSEEYPKENYFDNYITKHGGGDNAHTDYENTTFYFDVQEKNFDKALSIFANFFISPLMKVEAMQRERKAVHSEFQDSMTEDDSRRQQLLASMASEAHPMSVFAWGNETTLQLNVPDAELHKTLHEIRNRLYSAHYMTLAVQARESLDSLQELVVDVFSKVPNNGLDKPKYDHHGIPYLKEKFHRLYKVIPVNDKHTLDISWAMPTLQKHYEVKPLQYLSFLLGHEGHGSILSYFKKRLWAIEIYSGNDESGFEHNSTYASFDIKIRLTEEGLAHIEDVVTVVFQYLHLLTTEGPSERLFSELQKMEQVDFDFSEERSTCDNVEGLSEAMQLYPPQHVLTGRHIFYQYDPKLIQRCLSELKPELCNLMLCSKSFEYIKDSMQQEKWYGTKFLVEDIPQQWLKSWQNAGLNNELHLPAPNPFIPDDFTVFSAPDKPGHLSQEVYPEKIVSNPFGELWFKQDFKFGLPRAYCYIYFYFPDFRSSATNAAMVDLFLNLFNQHCMEALYPADMAQYETCMVSSEWGFVIKINGFSQKLLKCVETFMLQFDDFEAELSDNTFEEMKLQQIKNYHNYALEPDVLCRDTRLVMLQDVHWRVVDKIKAMTDITKDMFLREFFHKILHKNYIKILIQGNMMPDVAKQIYSCVSGRWTRSKNETGCPVMKVRRCLDGEWMCRIASLNEASSNSAITNYYQGEDLSLETELLNEFVVMAMTEPIFDVLRTKHQLGYHVYCTNRNTFGVLGVSVTVNSHADKHSASHVDERIESFLTDFCDHLKQLPEKEMADLKETLASFKLNVDLTLKEEMDRNWSEIVTGENIFSRFALQLPLIPKITAAEAADYLRGLVAPESKGFRKLGVQIVGSSCPDDGAVPCYQETLKKSQTEVLNYLKATDEDQKGGHNPDRFIFNPREFSTKMKIVNVKSCSKSLEQSKLGNSNS